MDRSRALVAAALLLVVAACGKSREEELFEQIERECNALVGEGKTLRDALIQLDPQAQNTDCRDDLLSLGGNNTCEPLPAQQCQIYLLWVPRDPDLCRTGRGCCLACEVRIMEDVLAAQGVDAPLCATQFRRGISVAGVC